MLHLELGPPFVVDDFDSKLHSPSSAIVAPFSGQKDAAQRTTIHAPYDTRSLGSQFTSSSQSDCTEPDTPDTGPNFQYITIYPSHGSPIRPNPFDFPTTEPDTHSYFGDDEDHDDETVDSVSLTGKVVDIVCDTFIGELRRMIPGGEGFEFDADLYEKMDDRLIQAPADVFYDLCLEESSPSNRTPPNIEAVSDDRVELLNEPIDLAEEWFRVCLLSFKCHLLFIVSRQAMPQILPPIHWPTTGPCRTNSQDDYQEDRRLFTDGLCSY
jgi:hypothetical protein